MVGPCLCGDPGCPSCGDPEREAMFEALESFDTWLMDEIQITGPELAYLRAILPGLIEGARNLSVEVMRDVRADDELTIAGLQAAVDDLLNERGRMAGNMQLGGPGDWDGSDGGQ